MCEENEYTHTMKEWFATQTRENAKKKHRKAEADIGTETKNRERLSNFVFG